MNKTSCLSIVGIVALIALPFILLFITIIAIYKAIVFVFKLLAEGVMAIRSRVIEPVFKFLTGERRREKCRQIEYERELQQETEQREEQERSWAEQRIRQREEQERSWEKERLRLIKWEEAERLRQQEEERLRLIKWEEEKPLREHQEKLRKEREEAKQKEEERRRERELKRQEVLRKQEALRQEVLRKQEELQQEERLRLWKEAIKVRIEEELLHIRTIKRPEINEAIRHAREYGVYENFEYQAARQSQAIWNGHVADLNGHVAELEAILSDRDADEVGEGNIVLVYDINNDEEWEFTIVDAIYADPMKDKISISCSVGRSFIGKRVGDTVITSTPNGIAQYKVLGIF